MNNDLMSKIDKTPQYFTEELFVNSFNSLIKDKYKEKNKKILKKKIL